MQWKEEVGGYLKHLEHRNWSASTVKGQRKMLEAFFRFTWRFSVNAKGDTGDTKGHRKGDAKGETETKGQELRGPADVTFAMILEYQRYLATQKSPTTGRPFAVATQRHYLSAVKAFYRWLEAEGGVLVSPAADVELPREAGRRAGKILSEKEAEKLVEAPNISRPLGVRDRAILELLYSTGLRVAELRALSIYDVDLGAGVVRVDEGKGKKGRLVPLGETAAHYVTEYVTNVRTRYARKKRRAPNSLFLLNKGEPMTEKAVRNLVYKYASEVGVSASPHTIRRSASTHLLADGAPPEVVQQMLGHGDGRSLRFYARLYGPELKEEHHRAHPRERDEP